MSLFGSTASGGRSSSKNLVEFRAGKMSLKGTTVTADKRRGLVYVQQSDDALTHFCWKDRTSGKVEDDLIIFPDDCEFKRVPQCTTGRVYILKFKSSSRKFFFWMQEPKTDKDEENCKKVNDSLNNPPSGGGSGSSSLGGADQHGNLQELFANMDQEQIMQLMASGGLGGNLGGLSSLLGGGGGRQSSRTSNRNQTSSSSTRSTARPATTTATTTAQATERASVTPAPAVVTPAPVVPAATPAATDSAATGLQLSQLQNILSQMGAMPDTEPVDLSKAITPDVMIPILANAEVQERLKPYLPQGESIPSTAEELRATIKSAQFRQAMSSFSEALATGQLGPVLKQFGLPVSAQDAAAKGDVEGFAKAMQESESKSGEKKSDKEEDMVVE